MLDKVAEVGDWGRAMPAGTAQGIAMHTEYKGATAVLVEIDCRPADGQPRRSATRVTGPRVTKVVVAVDAGLVDQPARPGGADDGRRHATASRWR